MGLSLKRSIAAYSAVDFTRLFARQVAVGVLTIGSASAVSPKSASPGTLTYIVGEACINAQPLSGKSGSVALKADQLITTRNGMVELMLAADIFMRVGMNSSVKLISQNDAKVEVELKQGQAIAEIGELPKTCSIRLLEKGALIQLLKTGIYEFDADRGQFRVFRGEAFVQEGGQRIAVTSGHQLTLISSGELRASQFNKKEFERTDLYRFSSERSKDLANADHWESYYWPGWHGSGRRTF